MNYNMDTIKIGKRLMEVVDLCYTANLPFLLIGPHGVGKSESLEQAANAMGIGFICRDLSLMEPTDLLGLPKEQKGKTVYNPPAFLPSNGKGLLVFEELNRCERYMRQPCLQLLTARTLNDYTLPSGWLPVAAINPSDEDYQTEELDPALLSRFVQVNVVADTYEWLTWARGNGVHQAVIQHVELNREIFDAAESNPRAWTKVSNVLKAAERNENLRAAVRPAVLGLVGEVRGTSFLAQFRTGADSPLGAEDVLHEYEQYRNRVRDWIVRGHVELVERTLRNLMVHLQPEETFLRVRGDGAQWGRLGAFFCDLPGDFNEQAQWFFREREYDFPLQDSM